MATFERHEDAVWSLAGLQGGCLLSGSADDMLKIWELATGICMATLDGHDGDVLSLAVLEGGRLASGSADYTIKIWDLAASEPHNLSTTGLTGRKPR